jgi:hypothetical protein
MVVPAPTALSVGVQLITAWGEETVTVVVGPPVVTVAVPAWTEGVPVSDWAEAARGLSRVVAIARGEHREVVIRMTISTAAGGW